MVMRYSEETSLFNLHNIDYDALTSKISKSKKNITINLTRLEPFLKLIQSEYRIVNKSDIAVVFELTVSGGSYPTVMIKIDYADQSFKKVNMLPHISSNARSLNFDMSLHDFNKYDLTAEAMFLRLCNTYAGKVSNEIICDWYSYHLLTVLKKIDTLLNYNGSIYKEICEKGIYVETTTISFDYVNVKISTKEFIIESKAQQKIVYLESLFSVVVSVGTGINFDDIKIKFDMYGQTIKLSYHEFMNASVKDIERAIISVIKLKNININDMDNLKAELALHEMLSI